MTVNNITMTLVENFIEQIPLAIVIITSFILMGGITAALDQEKDEADKRWLEHYKKQQEEQKNNLTDKHEPLDK